MFSSHERLKNKTPAQGIGRREFIEHLVEEFHTTTNIEAQEQVTANLANFAYDPINWKYLQEAEAVELFVQLLGVPNERIQLHGVAGLCNICLDPLALVNLKKPKNFQQLVHLFLQSENLEIVLNYLALFLQLLKKNEADFKQLIVTPDIMKRILHWKQSHDVRITNLCAVFLVDFGTRIEILELTLRRLSNNSNLDKGIQVTIVKRFTQEDLDQFSRLSGDFNPIHSVATPKSQRMVHGALLNAVVSGIIGTQMPGYGSVLLEQKLTFPNPCRVDVDTEITVRLLKERKISLVSYECYQGSVKVFSGEAKLFIKKSLQPL